MILSKIPKYLDTYSIQIDNNNNNVVKKYNRKEMDQLFLSVIPLQHTYSLVNQEFQKVCQNKVCCEAFVKYTIYDVAPDRFGYTYRLTVFSGREDYMDVENENVASQEMHCAIVACTNDGAVGNKCGSRFFPSDNVVPSVKFTDIRITMSVELNDLEDEDLMVMPTNVDFHLLPLPVNRFAYTASEIFNENK